MPVLTVDLQEGFADDLVEIRINDREVFRQAGVSTQLLLGYAASFETPVRQGTVKIEINLPRKNLSKTIVFQVLDRVFLGVSVQGDQIFHTTSPKPFGYM